MDTPLNLHTLPSSVVPQPPADEPQPGRRTIVAVVVAAALLGMVAMLGLLVRQQLKTGGAARNHKKQGKVSVPSLLRTVYF